MTQVCQAKVKFRSRYDYVKWPGINFSKSPSKTKQYFRKEADINEIVARGKKTGFLVDPTVPVTRKPMFGDFSNVPDLVTMQSRISAVNDAFGRLPANVRDRFANDPVRALEFLSDPKNAAEAESLGLKAKSAPAPASTPAMPAPANSSVPNPVSTPV